MAQPAKVCCGTCAFWSGTTANKPEAAWCLLRYDFYCTGGLALGWLAWDSTAWPFLLLVTCQQHSVV